MAEIDNKLNDPLNTTPRVPSVGGALKQMQDITREQVQSTERLGQLEAEKLKQTPLIQAEKLKAEKAYRDVAAKEKESDIAAAERDMSQFKVSQDSITGMSALGTAILMLGQALGRSGGQQSAMGAIQGMTGMMQGYSKGRAEEFKRNQIEFERNFKILQDKIKRANDKFQAALAEMPYNTIEAQTKAAQALAELDSPILKEKYNKQGLVETAGFVKTLFDASQKAADRANQLAVAATKATGANLDQSSLIYNYTGAKVDPKKAAPEIIKLAQSVGEADDLKEFVKKNADLIGRSGQINQAIEKYKNSWEQGYEPDDQGQPALIFAKRYAAYLVNYERSLAGGARGFTVQFQKRFNDLLKQDQFNAKGFEQLMDDQIREMSTSAAGYSGNINRDNMVALGRDITRRGGTSISDQTPSTQTSTAEKDQAIQKFGAYEPDKYTYGSDEKGFYRERK